MPSSSSASELEAMTALLGERSAMIAVVGIHPNNIDDEASNASVIRIYRNLVMVI